MSRAKSHGNGSRRTVAPRVKEANPDAAPSSSLRPDLEPRLRCLPTTAGVYLFRDRRGRVLYVGKAKNLRSRVRSYFRVGGDGRATVSSLVRQVQEIETIVATNETEALLLEDALIKDHKPRYNIRLRDDKSFPFLRVRRDDPFPTIELVRRPKPDGNSLFGPYADSAAARETARVAQQVFALRTCSNAKFAHRSRPCLDHQIGRCPAPCVGRIDEAGYAALVDAAERFLAGDREGVLADLESRMQAAAEALDFEQAALLRDRIAALKATAASPLMVRPGAATRDTWAVAAQADGAVVLVLHSVAGTVVDRDVFPGVAVGDSETLEQAVLQYYRGERPIPERIDLPPLGANLAALAAILSERRGKAVTVADAARGDGRRLLRIAAENAVAALGDRAAEPFETRAAALERALKLPRTPVVIECYDVSVHQGSEPVGVGVCFDRGSDDPERRRRYRLTPGEGRGDVQWLQEMLERRLRRGIEAGDLPDLIVIDGGIAQLNAALHVARALEVEWQRVPIVALAKARSSYNADDVADTGAERVYLPGRRNPVVLKPGTPQFRLLVSLRDATHRAAVGYHRSRGRSRMLAGIEQIPGLGPKRRRRLLDAFSSLEAVAFAAPEHVAKEVGIPHALAVQLVATIRRLQQGEGWDTLNEETI